MRSSLMALLVLSVLVVSIYQSEARPMTEVQEETTSSEDSGETIVIRLHVRTKKHKHPHRARELIGRRKR
ncbi:hypothetical protein AAVH_36406 [Aphelenchoides avenae]|nr:hypothetical protein AAVH_36406 [Aphelenchus avenae]